MEEHGLPREDVLPRSRASQTPGGENCRRASNQLLPDREDTGNGFSPSGHWLFSPLPAEGRLDSDAIMFSKKPFLAAPPPRPGPSSSVSPSFLVSMLPLARSGESSPVWAGYKDAVCSSRTLPTHVGLGFLTRRSWGRVTVPS